MELTNRMKELTQNIMSSSEERKEGLAEIKEKTNILRQEAVDMIKDFPISRGKASRQLRQELAQSNTDRRKEVIQGRKEATSLIHDFHDSRLKSGERLRKSLSQGSKILVQNEKKRKQEVRKMLSAFQISREENSTELRKDLAEGKAKIKLEVKEMLVDAKNLISGYQSSRGTMEAELKNDLGKDRDERKVDVEDMLDGFRKAQAEVRTELKGASDTWKQMGSVTRKKTSGGKAAQGIAVEISPKLEEKLLLIVNQHTGGITLSKVAEELGIFTIVLGKAAKVLLEQGKIRKEEKNYFPVTT